MKIAIIGTGNLGKSIANWFDLPTDAITSLYLDKKEFRWTFAEFEGLYKNIVFLTTDNQRS